MSGVDEHGHPLHDATDGDPGGPLVGCCAGARCTALRRLAGPADGLDGLRDTVRHTRGEVLLALSCVGLCAHGAVVVLAHRPPPRSADACRQLHDPTVVLGPVERGAPARALQNWVRASGLPAGPVPPVLRPLQISRDGVAVRTWPGARS